MNNNPLYKKVSTLCIYIIIPFPDVSTKNSLTKEKKVLQRDEMYDISVNMKLTLKTLLMLLFFSLQYRTLDFFYIMVKHIWKDIIFIIILSVLYLWLFLTGGQKYHILYIIYVMWGGLYYWKWNFAVSWYQVMILGFYFCCLKKFLNLKTNFSVNESHSKSSIFYS